MKFDELYGQVKDTVGVAAEKINRTADLATLQVKLSVAEHRLNEAYADLGRAAFRYFEDTASFQAEEMAKLMATVKASEQVCCGYREQIETLKNAKK